MKLTLDWLRDFVDLPTDDPEELASILENVGHEVEAWRRIEPTFQGVVVGRVVEVAPHPNADKVRVTQVDVGDGAPLEIVCGAWNFEAGAVVPVALPGALLQGDFTITQRKIRGVVSNGMICSEHELEIGSDAEGIMVLDEDYPDAADRIGEDFATLLPQNDAIFDVKITPNRPDAMSVYGLAVDLAAYFDVPVRAPEISVTEVGEPSTASVTITDEVACPRFAAREVRNITVRPSPHWLRYRLRNAGVRPISNVVDASNYAMIELGHPTHAFDMDRLGSTVVVRHAREGERVVTLDDVERELLPEDIAVADADRPVAIAGVMGGATTEVHDDSSRVLIEAAYWHPPSVLLTSKRLGLRSEASARFERGMDPSFCALAADRVAQLLEQIASGEAAPNPVDEYPAPFDRRTIPLPLAEIERSLGIAIDAKTAADLLRRLQMEVTGTDPLVVTVPTRRPDLVRPVDLVEEIARLHGYDKIPDRIRTGPGGGLPVREQRLRKLRTVLNGAGYYESMTFSFLNPDDADLLGLPAEDPARAGVRIINPLREEEGVLRTTLLPGLLRSAAINETRHGRPTRLYEIAKVFLPGAGKLPEQPDRLGFVAARTDGDVYDATGLWELLAAELHLPDASVTATIASGYHPGRCAALLLDGEQIGVAGEVHPRASASFGLTGRVLAGELDLAPLLIDRGPWRFQEPSTYPPVIFDLAWAMAETIPSADVLAAIDESAGPWLEARSVFDVFRGSPLGEGMKSLAVRITLRAPDRTLSDEEAAPVRRAIAAAVEEATGGRLRGEA